MRLQMKKCIHLMVILLALIETFTGAVIDCVIYTIFYPISLDHDASAASDYYFTAYLLPTKHFYRLIIVLYVPILYLWRSHGVGRLAEGSLHTSADSAYGRSTVFGVIYTRFPRRILPATAEWLWYWLRALQSTNSGVLLADNSEADCNWQSVGRSTWHENRKSVGALVQYGVQQQHNSVIRQYNTRVCCIHFYCFGTINLLSIYLFQQLTTCYGEAVFSWVCCLEWLAHTIWSTDLSLTFRNKLKTVQFNTDA